MARNPILLRLLLLLLRPLGQCLDLLEKRCELLRDPRRTGLTTLRWSLALQARAERLPVNAYGAAQVEQRLNRIALKVVLRREQRIDSLNFIEPAELELLRTRSQDTVQAVKPFSPGLPLSPAPFHVRLAFQDFGLNHRVKSRELGFRCGRPAGGRSDGLACARFAHDRLSR